jgi:flavin-dependent dehydrogenase
LWRYLRDRGLQPTSVEKHAWMIPLAPRATELARDGVFLVGDAAGLVDPITCEGISAALSSGDLAARSLQQAALEPAAAMIHYQRALQADLLAELHWARRLARLLYGPRWMRQFLFEHHGDVFCAAMGRVISGRETYRSLLANPAHLKRLFLGSGRRTERMHAGSDTR